jgi:hypothetical protein
LAFNVRVSALVRPVLLQVLSYLNHRKDSEYVAKEFPYLLPLVRRLVCDAKTALGSCHFLSPGFRARRSSPHFDLLGSEPGAPGK